MLRVVVLLAVAGSLVAASSECMWVIGQLVCSNEDNLANAVVEVWENDALTRNGVRMNVFDTDDLAGRTVVAKEENGRFKVEGCASDFDWLGPLYKNQPEFYLKVIHHCRGVKEVLRVTPPDTRLFAPQTVDYFLNNPINLG